MANATTKPVDRTDGIDAGDRSLVVATGPYILDEILARGATLHGVAVASVRILTTDGRLQTLTFRVSEGIPTTRMEAKIVSALRSSDVPLTRKQIAHALKLGSVRGRFGRTVSAMKLEGKIFEKHELYTDDKTKFGKMT
ncbi:MAG: hypothetical protein JNK93_10130 [Planctomycetia bacterium]|nr:hypothetical protein [Planctomycetia bacterium]